MKKRYVFGKYIEQVEASIDELIEKVIEHDAQRIDNSKMLKLPPFDQLGSKTQIHRGIIGGLDQYQQAVKELENELYSDDLTA